MINRVVLVGRLTRDPELRSTQNGISVTRFTLACDRPFTGQEGKREADFIDCVVWRKQAENVAQYLSKGKLAGVEGRLQISSYKDKEQQTRYRAEVVADSVRFLESKGSNGPVPAYEPPASSSGRDAFSSGGNMNLSDDDLPF